MYVKLFSSILDSTIWAEGPETRIVWITMLAMADKDGDVRCSPSGLARRANVTPEAANVAVGQLLAPDADSATPDYEGRRIEAQDGGWHILNYVKYREIQDREARKESWRKASKRRYEATKAERVSTFSAEPLKNSTEADTDTEADTKKKKQRAPKDGATWLTPYLLAWESKNGAGSGVAIAGRLAKALKPLHDANGEGTVLGKLAIYLSQTDAQFRSPQAFAQRFSSWGEVSAPVATKQQQSTAALTGWLNQQEQTDGLLDHDSGNTRVLRRALPRRADFGSDG